MVFRLLMIRQPEKGLRSIVVPIKPYTALARPPRAKWFVAKSEIWTKPVLLYYLYYLRLAALFKAV